MEKSRIPKFKRKNETQLIKNNELKMLLLFEKVFQAKFSKEKSPLFVYQCKPSATFFQEISKWILLIDEFSNSEISLQDAIFNKVEFSLHGTQQLSSLKLGLENHAQSAFIQNILKNKKSNSGFKILYSTIENSIIFKRTESVVEKVQDNSNSVMVNL